MPSDETREPTVEEDARWLVVEVRDGGGVHFHGFKCSKCERAEQIARRLRELEAENAQLRAKLSRMDEELDDEKHSLGVAEAYAEHFEKSGYCLTCGFDKEYSAMRMREGMDRAFDAGWRAAVGTGSHTKNRGHRKDHDINAILAEMEREQT